MTKSYYLSDGQVLSHTLNNKNNNHQSKSKFNNFKSALIYLHDTRKVPMSQETSDELFLFIDGYSRFENDMRVSGELKPTPGKNPLPFEVYTRLCEIAIQCSSAEKDSYHLYNVLGWNLCTRSINTGKLKYSHIRWMGDRAMVSICGGKTNQLGMYSFER
jgi:aspartyl/asparaginyl beta-hydroxylase (cupin superfamily)